jgi:phage terminase large subunit-like protein
LAEYRPYTKQKEFHDAGNTHRERLLRAGNQLGKTYSGAAEMAYHLTGDYPEWWEGRRFNMAIAAWVGGPSAIAVRDTVQRLLLGRPGQWGTGMIPKSMIIGMPRMARGTPDAVDTVRVRTVWGSESTLSFKSYEQGREKWQGETLHCVWLDEEPDLEIYTEALSRTNATRGMVYMTFTPLLGVSDVVMRFLKETSPDRHDTVMTIDDAEHIPAAERQRIIDSYPEHEREARTRGVPILGSGRVFPFPRSMLAIEPMPIPKHWARLGALDFGWDHPTAAVRIAHDRDADVVYVTDIYRVRQESVAIHAAALRAWGKDMPWAWPHDALQHDKGSGQQIKDLYERNGLNMTWEMAQFEGERGNGVEAGVMEMIDRMQTNRLKVFSQLNDWFDEFDLYHRKDGKLVKERDDLMSATRYALMMLRYAKAGADAAPNDPYSRRSKFRVVNWMAA